MLLRVDQSKNVCLWNIFEYELSLQNILVGFIFKLEMLDFSNKVNLIIEIKKLTC